MLLTNTRSRKCKDCKKEIRVSGDDTDKRFKDFIGYDSKEKIHFYKCRLCDSESFDPSTNQ